MAYKYSADLYAQVQQNWKRQPFEGAPEVACPAEATFKQVAEEVYQASLLTEEQRRVAIKVMIASIAEVAHFEAKSIPFQTPVPLSAAALIKLSPALDISQSMLGVSDGQIWGIVDIGSAWSRLNTGLADIAFTPPSLLSIESEEPGELVIEQGGESLAELKHGQIVQGRRFVLDEEPISTIIAGTVQQMMDEREAMRATLENADEEKRWCTYRVYSFIHMLLRLIRGKKHGGTLLIVPRTEIGRLAGNLTIKHACSDGRLWNLVIQRPNDEFRDKFADFARFTATLAGVDGAVLLTDKLELQGFGVRIISPGNGLVDAEVVGTTERRSVDAKGTRHASAMRFSFDLHPSIAFVVSQDGGISAMSRGPHGLRLWTNMWILE